MATKKLYVKTEEEVIRRKTTSITVEMDFVQMYSTLLDYLVGIKSVWSVKYLLWIISSMNDSNDTKTTSIADFIAYIKTKGIVPPAERTMKDVIKELLDNKLIIRLGRGFYKINPMLFWKDNSGARLENIEHLTSAGVSLSKPEPKPALVESTNKQEEELNDLTKDSHVGN